MVSIKINNLATQPAVGFPKEQSVGVLTTGFFAKVFCVVSADNQTFDHQATAQNCVALFAAELIFVFRKVKSLPIGSQSRTDRHRIARKQFDERICSYSMNFKMAAVMGPVIIGCDRK